MNEIVKFLDQRFCQIFCIKSSTSTALAILGQVFGGYIRGQPAKPICWHAKYAEYLRGRQMTYIIQDRMQDKFSVVNCRIFWVRAKPEHCAMQIRRMQYSELKNPATFKDTDYCNEQPHSSSRKRNQLNLHTQKKTAFCGLCLSLYQICPDVSFIV